MSVGITPVTRDEQFAGALSGDMPVESLPKAETNVEKYLKYAAEHSGGGGGGFTPTDEQLAAMNSGATTEKINQIETNKNNISKLFVTGYTTPRLNLGYGLTLVWGGYAIVGNLCIVNMRLSCTSNIPVATNIAFELPRAITTDGLSMGSIFCSLTNSLGLNIALVADFNSNKSNIANNLASEPIPAGNIIISGIYLCATE